jgi:Flp pilus assembly protein protease CpaA
VKISGFSKKATFWASRFSNAITLSLSLLRNDTDPIPLHQFQYHEQPMTWLLIYVFAISLYDLRTHRIPNWFTLPLIIAGVIAHFPGQMDLWLACFLLVSAWSGGRMGAGDVKLWMAILWGLPDTNIPSLILLVFLSFLFTGILQMLWRFIRREAISGIKSPAAWRVIPFLLMFWYVH